jgi:cellulose biosynthesis protein BcsQ
MVEPDHRQRNANVIALANNKGGAGKSSITANLAGALADMGHKVLVLDIDLSGDLPVAFGVDDHELNDAGASLVEAILDPEADLPVVIEGIRPGIDWIPGGIQIWHLVTAQIRDDYPISERFAEVLSQISPDYDYVLLDCPPSNPPLQEMALAATRWLMVPARPDPTNWAGLQKIGPVVRHVRTYLNPNLAWLGVVIFGMPAGASRINRVTLDYLGAASSTVPVLDSAIRYQSAAALSGQVNGRLAAELSAARKGETAAVIEALRGGRKAAIADTARIPASIASLAADYKRLAEEVVALTTASTKKKRGVK